MGTDKALLEWNGVTLLDRTIAVMRAVAYEVLVIGRDTIPGGDSDAPVVSGARRAAFRSSPQQNLVRTIPDQRPGRGPLGGLATGLAAASHPYLVVTGCDLPWLDVGALRYLLSLTAGWDAVVPRVDGRAQTLHAVYSRTLLPDAERLLQSKEYRVACLLDGAHVRWVEGDEFASVLALPSSLRDVDTPTDWNSARLST